MATEVRVSIVTPEADVLNVSCEEVIVPGEAGEIGVLPGHVSLVSALHPGVLTTVRGGKKTYFVVNSGFIEVSGDNVSVITDTCEEAGKVDAERAKRALQGALSRLMALGPEDPGYAEAQKRATMARARLEGASRVDPSVRLE